MDPRDRLIGSNDYRRPVLLPVAQISMPVLPSEDVFVMLRISDRDTVDIR